MWEQSAYPVGGAQEMVVKNIRAEEKRVKTDTET